MRGRADPKSTRSCGRPTGLGVHTHQFHDQSTTRRDATRSRFPPGRSVYLATTRSLHAASSVSITSSSSSPASYLALHWTSPRSEFQQLVDSPVDWMARGSVRFRSEICCSRGSKTSAPDHVDKSSQRRAEVGATDTNSPCVASTARKPTGES